MFRLDRGQASRAELLARRLGMTLAGWVRLAVIEKLERSTET